MCTTIAGFARLLHPLFAAEFLESFGIFPNLAHAAVLHVFKLQARDDCGGVAGKRVAARRDEHELAAPAAYTGFGIFRVIVRHDKEQAGVAR